MSITINYLQSAIDCSTYEVSQHSYYVPCSEFLE